MTNATQSVPVLIVGAGPVGLALAGDLGWRGVRCLVIEQSDGSIYQPKMDLVGIRTMEHCRRWNIVDAVERSPYPRDRPQDNVYATSLSGYELGREHFLSMAEDKPPAVSPQKRERCPQNMFDPILRAFASAQDGVELRYHTRLISFFQTAEGVTVEVEDTRTSERYTIHTDYLAGCDGAASGVREGLGIGMNGQPALTYTTNIIFRCANLPGMDNQRQAYRYILIGEEGTWATIVAINGKDQWRMSLIGSTEPKLYKTEEIQVAIRRAVGADFEYEILSVVPWIRKELVATSYGKGRCFILGDAAHVMSPTGGFGMNTGIGDAVDLSWKLAAVLQGWGATALLASYEMERRPVAERNVAEASKNLRNMLSPGPQPNIEADGPVGDAVRSRVGEAFSERMRNEWFTLGIHLGYRYDDSPICWSDRTPAPPYETQRYVPMTRPGSRAPHVWLSDGRSTLDLFGRGFVLLRIGSAAPEVEPFVEAAATFGMPLEVIYLDTPEIIAVYRRLLVLVRPDGHVAWSADWLPDDPRTVLDCVRGGQLWAWALAKTDQHLHRPFSIDEAIA